MTPRERVEAAGRWLVSVGGAATPGEIGSALGGLNGRRQADVVNALREGGWVDGPKGRLSLTPAGYARFAGVGPVAAGEVLDRVVSSVYPERFYAHRALQRLHVSAVVARWHLHAARPEGHLTFVSRGQEGTGKTTLYRLTCDLLGVDPLAAVVEPDDETAASLGGRRAAGSGGRVARDTPLIATLPLVVFDDVDKMRAEVRQAFWPYLRGAVRQLTEGELRTLRPVAAVTYNPRPGQDPDRLLPNGWARRSVLLDADYALANRGELRRAVTAYYRPENAPQRGRDRLDLDALTLPAASLSGEGLAVLETVAGVFVDPDRAWPAAGLELAALGRAALLGDGDHIRAAVVTAVDYLMVAATVPGILRDDWPAYTAHVVQWEAQTGRHDVADALAAYGSARRVQAVAARRRRLAHHVDSIDLVGVRAELVARLEQAEQSIRTVPPAHRARARGIRAQLGELRRRAVNAKTAAALTDVEATAAEPLGLAADVRQAVDAERAQAAADKNARELERRQAVEDQRRAAQAQRVAERQARDHYAAVLDQVVTHAKELERLYRRTKTREGEDPLRELCAVRITGGYRLLAYTPPTQEPVKGWRGIFAAQPQGRWSSTGDSRVSFPGTGDRCPDLRQWGPATQAVLAPLLAELYATEDELRARLGRRARRRTTIAGSVSAVAAPTGRLALPA